MRRKTMRLVVMLAFVLLTVPLAAHAQPATKVYRIGFVRITTASANASENEAFTQRLRELGYTEGQNLVIECALCERPIRACSCAGRRAGPAPGRLPRGQRHRHDSRRQTGDEHHPDRDD